MLDIGIKVELNELNKELVIYSQKICKVAWEWFIFSHQSFFNTSFKKFIVTGKKIYFVGYLKLIWYIGNGIIDFIDDVFTGKVILRGVTKCIDVSSNIMSFNLITLWSFHMQ